LACVIGVDLLQPTPDGGRSDNARPPPRPPDDFDVIHDGEIVGRIYRMNADRELWRWTIIEGGDGATFFAL
jgi:hypothetical protein